MKSVRSNYLSESEYHNQSFFAWGLANDHDIYRKSIKTFTNQTTLSSLI